MPTTLTNGIQLPDKGSVDWYNSMQSNYNLIDTHLGDTDVHVTAEDKARWDGKQGSLSQAQLDAIAQVATNTSDIATLQSGKANTSHTHSSSDITDIDDYATKQYVDNSISDLVDNAPDALNTLNELSAALNDDSNFASTVTTALATKANSADLATVATSGDYDDLSNKPTINDSTITIQKNGSTVDTFTTNGSNKTINIPVPTKTSDITNDSNFVDTSNSAVASGITSAKVTSYDSHIADTDIHVTTADKNRWNNNTYVFRYSSTALVASSTNANSLLDNTDNLKVGDKVIDSDGVLFSITAIDTANSTFTIGTALVDLALDANVVHTSGNENVGGIKNFTDYTYIRALNFTNGVASPSSSDSAVMPIVTTVTYTDQSPSQTARLNFRITANGDKSLFPHENNQYALGLTTRKWSEVHATTYYYGSSDTEFSQKFVTTDTAQTIGGVKTFADIPVFSTLDGIRFRCAYNSNAFVTFRNSNQAYPGSIILSANDGSVGTTIHIVDKTLIPYNTNDINLGTALRKWKTFNGLNPSSLGMPDLSNGVDISSYIDVSQTSQYTAPANGYISICGSTTANNNAILIKDHNYDFGMAFRSLITSSGSSTYLVMPVIKNHVYDISCSAVATIDYAKFFPCQGNV